MTVWQILGQRNKIRPGTTTISSAKEIALVMPIYKANDLVIPFLKTFKREDFGRFVVIDDGSGKKYSHIYKEIAKMDGFEVISYPVNGGKGHALKEAVKLIKGYEDIKGIVTADGDGQHAYEDILKIRDSLIEDPDKLIMGVRDLDGHNVPKRSKVGNTISRTYTGWISGIKPKDNQTGLRGIPRSLFDLMLSERSERYQFEMEFFHDALKKTNIKEVPIATIYLNDNSESHFRPFEDTVTLYKRGGFFLIIAICSFLIDVGMVALFQPLFAGDNAFLNILLTRLAAHGIWALIDLPATLIVVYPYKEALLKRLASYLLAFVLFTAVSACLSYLLSLVTPWNPLWLIVLFVDLNLCAFIYSISLLGIHIKGKRRTVK